MHKDFLAEGLSSKQLLAFLYVCECGRKGLPTHVPSAYWDEFRMVFADRFRNLNETLRFEVLEAHLMSVEDVDIYNDETLAQALRENSQTLGLLQAELEKDKRFA